MSLHRSVRNRLRIIAGLIGAVAWPWAADASPPASDDPREAASTTIAATDAHRPSTVEEATLEKIRSFPVGDYTLGDLHGEEGFLGRAADRMIRSDYQSKYHIVVRDEDFQPRNSATARGGDSSAASSDAPEKMPHDAGVDAKTFGRDRALLVACAAAVILAPIAIYRMNRRRAARSSALNETRRHLPESRGKVKRRR